MRKLRPGDIVNNVKQLGYEDAYRLLKELINTSDIPLLRERALEELAQIDNGSNYDFFESLFLSDKNLEICRIAARILEKNYLHSKETLSLLTYILKNIEQVEKKLIAIDILEKIDTEQSNSVLTNYFEEKVKQIKFSEINTQKKPSFTASSHSKPEKLISLGINLLLSQYYTQNLHFEVQLQGGFIHVLNCENAGLKEIRAVPALQRLTRLEELRLNGNKITKIRDISFLKGLKVLELANNSIFQINNLNELRNLIRLDLSYNRIEKIRNLDHLSNLRWLSLAHNQIDRIEKLGKLCQLESLNLSQNYISSISSLKNLSRLKLLDLSYNEIKKINNLEQLSNLISLHLNNNQTQKFEGLNSLSKLRELFLDNNNISTLTNIRALQKLAILSLNNNKISRFTNSEKEILKEINFVFLNANPLNQNSRLWYQKKIKG